MGAHPRWRWSTSPNQNMNPDSETTSVFLDLSPHLIHRTYIIIHPCPLYPSLYFPFLLRLSYRHFYDCCGNSRYHVIYGLVVMVLRPCIYYVWNRSSDQIQ